MIAILAGPLKRFGGHINPDLSPLSLRSSGMFSVIFGLVGKMLGHPS